LLLSDSGTISGLGAGALLQGRYRLIRELAGGPRASVFLADDHHLGDAAALKALVLPQAERARIRHEVMTAWEVTHDNIVAVRSCFEYAEYSFVAMDYVEGPSLAAQVAVAPLSSDETAAIGRGIALALQAAHRRGILHRHVTPGNVLIAPEVRARLTDFGSAGHQGGSGFTAPEVLGGQAADVRADLYGLGLCLFMALTGTLPERHASEGPVRSTPDGHRPSRVRPTVPPWLDDAIARATAALPADRFSSAGRFAEALAPSPSRERGSLISLRA
jgi:serine/threonine-protein kinase